MLLYLFCNKSHYENVPFEIPESWCWCKLSDVCNFESGYAFSSDDYKDKGTPLVRISNIQDGLVSLDNCVYIEGDIDKRFIINNGDLLIAMSGATTGKMGVYQYDCPALLNQRVGNIKVNTSLLLQKYRDYFMQSQGDLILKLSYGGAQPNVSAKIISDLFIPIPSLNEQEKIVAEIEKWFGFIDEIENGKIELESHIKQTKSKILDIAISGKLVPQDPNDEPAIELLKRIHPDFKPCDNSHYENLPENWEEIVMGEICKLYDGEKVSGPSLTYIDVKYLRGSKVGEFITSGKYVPQGSTLILVDGENSGEVFTTPIDGYQGSTFKILDITEYLDKEYVLLLIKRSQKLLRENKVGSAIPHLNKKMFKALIVPVPPLAEQKRIVATVNMLFYKLDMITAEL